ncbi:MAG: hypothetical protein J6N52_12580 [Clostridia bacterium]|nr:hypothetical protein [Clostridia bacterium]
MYTYIWYFLIYSVAGYICEVCFAAVCEKKFVNRGFLTGPVCPIYGFGVSIVYYILSPLRDTWLTLFISSVVVTSALEWITGFVMEKVFHHKWWDYSDIPFNLNGYVCLSFSLVWGAACIVVVKLLIPLTDLLIAEIPQRVGIIAQLSLIGLMIADLCNTVSAMIGLNRKIMSLAELSEKIRETGNKFGDKVTENAASLRAAYDKKLSEIGLGQKRLLAAFPKLKSADYHEQLLAVRAELERLKGKTAQHREELKERIVHAPVSHFIRRVYFAVPMPLRIAAAVLVVLAAVLEILIF